jgi:hypothetical protein
MPEYHLERLNRENAKDWADLNDTSPDGSLFHSLKWRQFAEQTSGVPNEDFILYRDDEVFGLFPLAMETIRGFSGIAPAHVPWTLRFILKDYRDPFAMQYLIDELRDECRYGKPISFFCLAATRPEVFDTIARYPRFPYPFYEGEREGELVIDLKRTPPDDIWNSFTSDSAERKKVRRFEKDGFELTEARSRGDLDIFYQYYEENVNQITDGLLTPFSYFSGMWDAMSDEIKILLLVKGSTVAGGQLLLSDERRKRVYLYFLALNRSLPTCYHPTVYLNWKSIVWAWENRYEKVSFGREITRNLHQQNPTYRIKKGFGATFEPIYSEIIPTSPMLSMGIRSRKYLDWGRSVRSRIQLHR